MGMQCVGVYDNGKKHITYAHVGSTEHSQACAQAGGSRGGKCARKQKGEGAWTWDVRSNRRAEQG